MRGLTFLDVVGIIGVAALFAAILGIILLAVAAMKAMVELIVFRGHALIGIGLALMIGGIALTAIFATIYDALEKRAGR